MNCKVMTLAALAAIALVSCNKEPADIAIVGDFNLTAEKDASWGWIPGDKVGIFVTSDGKPQENLAYSPSSVAQKDVSEYMPEYIMFKEAVGNVALKADGEAAGYKQGKHVIYAYYPYNEGAEDLTAIPMPDITVQDGSFKSSSADQSKLFCCASKTVEGEYSTAAIDLGKLEAKYFELNTGGISIDSEKPGLDALTIKSLEISASKPLAYENPTYNFETGKIEGTPSEKVTVNNWNMAISDGFFGLGTNDPAIFYVALTKEEIVTTEFTFTATLSDNSTLTGKATPKEMFGMVSFMGSIVLE